MEAIPMNEQATDTERMTGRLKDLAGRANRREPGALDRLRAFMDDHPEVWRTVGDLARLTEQFYLDLLAGDDVLVRESVRRTQEELRAELLGEDPTPTERMLVELVVQAHLALHQANQVAANPSASAAVSALRAKRVEGEQRRVLQAIRMLATLRQLLPRELPAAKPVKIFSPERRSA